MKTENKTPPTTTICHITSYGTSVISNFSVIPIRWLLTVDSEMDSFLFRSLAEDLFVFFSNSRDSRKINCLTGEFDSKCRWKSEITLILRDSCDQSVFQVKSTVELIS